MSQATSGESPAPGARLPAPVRILIVEDDAAIATILAMLLGVLGFRTEAVGNGADALAALAAGPLPDALLLDIRLPSGGPDGVALAQAVRARPEWSRLAVILMTAESYDEEATLAAAQADAFLRKPMPEAEMLAALIRQCVEQRNRR